MLINYTCLDSRFLPIIGDFLVAPFFGDQRELDNLKQLAKERLEQIAQSQIRALFAKKHSFKVIKLDESEGFALDLGVGKSKKSTFTAVIADLVVRFIKLHKIKENQLTPICEELRKLALVCPAFSDGVNLNTSNFSPLYNYLKFLNDMAPPAKADRGKMNQFVGTMQNETLACYTCLAIFEHLAGLFERFTQLEQLTSEMNFALFDIKPKTLWGRAFIKRWIDFSFQPPQLTLRDEEVGDFKRKYIENRHSNQEVRQMAYEVLKILRIQLLRNTVNLIFVDLCKAPVSFYDQHGALARRAVVQLGLTGFPDFISKVQPLFSKHLKMIQENPKRFCLLDKELISFLKEAAKDGIAFLPMLKCYYSMLYTYIHALPKKPDFGQFVLTKPGQPTFNFHEANSLWMQLIENEQLISDDGKNQREALPAAAVKDDPSPPAAAAANNYQPAAGAGAGAAESTPPAAVVDDDKEGWTVVKPKKPQHVPTMKYDQRVERWFTELKSHASWLVAPREVKVHAFSPLVDLFVNTNFSIEESWQNRTKPGHVDTCFRLVGDLIVPGKPEQAVVFRYTKGKDGLWYHRDMTFVVDEKMWRSAEFPELPARGKEQAKAVTVDWNNDSYTLDKATGTCMIDCGDHQIRLYIIKG